MAAPKATRARRLRILDRINRMNRRYLLLFRMKSRRVL
jgi:hypothetical protein